MKAYHGTNNAFSKFELSFLGLNTDANASSESLAQTAHLGFWFTSNQQFAETIYDKVMECEIDINKPLEAATLENLSNWIDQQEMTGEELREKLIEQGYDGIIIENDEEFEGTSYVVFSNEQITINK